MKIEQQFSEPEHVKDRQPYRVRIEGKDGQVIEIVEQMGGGFGITGTVPGLSRGRLVIRTVNQNVILIEVKE